MNADFRMQNAECLIWSRLPPLRVDKQALRCSQRLLQFHCALPQEALHIQNPEFKIQNPIYMEKEERF